MAGGSLNVKHLWIADPSGIGSPGSVNETTPEYKGQVGKVGTIKESAGLGPKTLQYVQRAAADEGTTTTWLAGNLAYWSDVDDFVVTSVIGEGIGTTTAPLVAGVILGTACEAGNYGLIQVAGVASVNVADAAIVVGPVVADGIQGIINVNNGTTAVDQLRPLVGFALAAQTVTTGSVAVLLDLCPFGW